ncbi:MAG: hypothetical protein ABFS09_02335 [Thermodesulfobacteriota bacterium]
MSKLFDTLEKIQEQENVRPHAEQAASPLSAKKTGRYLPFLVGLTVIVAIFAGIKYFPHAKKSILPSPAKIHKNTPAPAVTPSPMISHADSRIPVTTNLPSPQQVEQFNNHGVTLTQRGDAWAALYYFDKASKLAPGQPEPLVNMAIVLTQMDLGFPAARIFKEAYQLAPENDYLLQAIELAIAEQILPPDFYETMPVPGIEEN